MVNDTDWAVKRVNESLEAHPSVTDSVATRVRELITGKIMDRQLSAAELQVISKALLADNAPLASRQTGGTDAD